MAAPVPTLIAYGTTGSSGADGVAATTTQAVPGGGTQTIVVMFMGSETYAGTITGLQGSDVWTKHVDQDDGVDSAVSIWSCTPQTAIPSGTVFDASNRNGALSNHYALRIWALDGVATFASKGQRSGTVAGDDTIPTLSTEASVPADSLAFLGASVLDIDGATASGWTVDAQLSNNSKSSTFLTRTTSAAGVLATGTISVLAASDPYTIGLAAFYYAEAAPKVRTRVPGYKGEGSFVSNSAAGAYSVPMVTGLSEADFIILASYINKVAAPSITPAYNETGRAGGFTISTRMAGRSEGAASVTYSAFAAGNVQFGLSIGVSGADPTTPYEGLVQLAAGGGASPNADSTTITTTGPNRLLVYMVAVNDDTATTSVTLNGWTDEGTFLTTAGSDAALRIYTLQAPVAGTYTTPSFVLSASEYSDRIGLAIVPAAVPEDWSPSNLGVKLQGWLSVDDSASLDITSGNVENWRDQVGTRTFTEATARPEYSATGGPNGTPAILLDGTESLTLDSVPYPTGAAAVRIYSVCSQDSPGTDATHRYLFQYGDNTGANRRGIGRRVTSGVNRFKNSTGTSELAVNSVDFTGWHWVMAGWDGAGNAAAAIDTVAATPTAIAVNSGTTRTRIGANGGSTPGEHWLGKVSHIVTTTDDLTTAEIIYLQAWLADRVEGVVIGGASASGTASITEENDTLSATAALAIAGLASFTEADDTVSATGTLALAGALEAVNDNDILVATGTLTVRGAAELSDDDDILESAGVGVNHAYVDLVEEGDTLNAQGSILGFILAELDVTEDDDIVVATATKTPSPIEDWSTWYGRGVVYGSFAMTVRVDNIGHLRGRVDNTMRLPGVVDGLAQLKGVVKVQANQRLSR